MRVPVLSSLLPGHGNGRIGSALGTSALLLVLLAGLGLPTLTGTVTPAAAALPTSSGISTSGTAGQAGVVLDALTLSSLLQAPITLRVLGNSASLTLTSKVLRQAVVTDTVGVTTPTARLDQAKFNALVAPLATQVKIVPHDATVALLAGRPTLVADVAGQELDLQDALTATVTAATAPDRTALLSMRVSPAQVNAAAVQPFFGQWATMLTNGFTYRYNGRTWRVSGAAFAGYMKLTPDTITGGYQLVGIRNALDDRLWGVAGDINVRAGNSRFRLVNGQVRQTAVGHGGQQLDHTASLAAALAALTANQYQSDLIVSAQSNPFNSTVPQSVNTPDLLARSTTYYVGSSPERAHNVEFGTALVDGALVPPGAEFDTAGTMGPLTLAAGFQMGFGIMSDGKNVTTVPAEAGGICQVATTLFHSVFWAGLPITERNNHSYWISSYGIAPDGLQGLDATVSPPEKNFRWRNTTDNWILIRAHAARGAVTFDLWGTKPGWKVQVDKPVITKVVPTDRTPIYEKSNLFNWGVTRQVEHAQPGFSSDIHRQVFDAQGIRIDDWHAISTYLPSHNHYLVGQKGKPLPRPTATPAPSVVPTAQPTAQPTP